MAALRPPFRLPESLNPTEEAAAGLAGVAPNSAAGVGVLTATRPFAGTGNTAATAVAVLSLVGETATLAGVAAAASMGEGDLSIAAVAVFVGWGIPI